MSRGRKLTVAGLAAIALTFSLVGEYAARAQESQGTSLSQRISALSGVFKRKKSTPPTASKKPAANESTASATARTRTSSGQNSRTYAPSRRSLSSLLPKSLFGKKKANEPPPVPGIDEITPPELPLFIAEVVDEAEEEVAVVKAEPAKTQAEAKVAPKAKVDGRAGSAISETASKSSARKSPSTSRDENLQATLADLLQNEAIIAEPAEADAEQVATDEAKHEEASAEAAVEVAETEETPVEPEHVAEAEESEAEVEQVAEAVEESPAVEDEPALVASSAKTQADGLSSAKPQAQGVVVAKAAKAPVAKKERKSFDVSTAIESVAAETAAEEPAEMEAEVTEVAASKKSGASPKVDVHDTLLSGELYDELEEAEAEADQLAEETGNHEIEQTSPRLSRLPNPHAEERVAEVTALPFETMGEEPDDGEPNYAQSEIPEPEFHSAELDLTAEPDPQPHPRIEQERNAFAQRNRIRTDAQPITNLRKPQGDVLMTSEQPVIISHVEGPRSILVGREASYRVVLENTSGIAAQNLSAAIQVPEWADLVDVVSTSGEVARHGADTDSSALEWRLPELAARSSQTLRLRLIPRAGREFQLGVQWSQESNTAQARVEVQEPKLEMSIQGPQEVLFGAPQRFRLTIFNPGTGPAERVAVCLIPPGQNSASAATHVVGTLGPDEVKEIEMELTAREAGELILQASATAAGGLEAEAIKRVQCHKPELEVDWRGPDEKYAGTETAYFFRVRNPGSAPTDPLELRVRLPEGIRFLSASDSYAVDSTTGVVTWRMGGLAPGEEQFMQVRCQLDSPGAKEFDVVARTVNGELRDSKSIHTNVVALADLKLDITDPQGARPIGETVTYEIRVENRGTTDAHGVSIVGLFSAGIDPVSVEGAQNSVRDGRVTFQPVKSLPAGGEVLLRIRAVASKEGTHIFRAEVACQDLDLKLAAEETTRFFQDEFHWKEGETPYTAEQPSNAMRR